MLAWMGGGRRSIKLAEKSRTIKKLRKQKQQNPQKEADLKDAHYIGQERIADYRRNTGRSGSLPDYDECGSDHGILGSKQWRKNSIGNTKTIKEPSFEPFVPSYKDDLQRCLTVNEKEIPLQLQSRKLLPITETVAESNIQEKKARGEGKRLEAGKEKEKWEGRKGNFKDRGVRTTYSRSAGETKKGALNAIFLDNESDSSSKKLPTKKSNQYRNLDLDFLGQDSSFDKL